MTCLDASVVLALLNPDDAHHESVRRGVANLARPLLIHELTLAECLVRAVRAGRDRQVLDVLLDLCSVVGSPGGQGAHRLARLRATVGLALADCCALDAAIEHGDALATFDVRLARAAADLGVHLALD